MNNMWWGYLHSNGHIAVKRWYGDHADYTNDCVGNPFVIKVVKPFYAHDKAEAMDILKKELLR